MLDERTDLVAKNVSKGGLYLFDRLAKLKGITKGT